MAHACNPSYSGSKDKEDCGLKPAQANSSEDTITRKKNHKNRAGRVAQGEGPEFKIQYLKRKSCILNIFM
jgi:hypothetical protein